MQNTEIRTVISLQACVDYVNGVIDTATVDGVFYPALFEYAVRLHAILLYTNQEIPYCEDGTFDQDQACNIAFDSGLFEDIEAKSRQLNSLIGACHEQVRLEQEKRLAEMRPADQFERLVDMLEGFLLRYEDAAGGIDGTMLEQLATALSASGTKELVGAVAGLKQANAAPKKRGRPKGSKAKAKPTAKVEVVDLKAAETPKG